MTRDRLPQRRICERFDLQHNAFEFAVTAGVRPDGSIGEVFVSAHRRVGTEVAALARDTAVVLSLALQHGCSLQTIASALTRDPEGRPAGIAGAVVDGLLVRLNR